MLQADIVALEHRQQILERKFSRRYAIGRLTIQ